MSCTEFQSNKIGINHAILCLDRYLRYGKSHQWLFSHTARLWSHCMADGPKFKQSYCWKPEFLNKFCPLFPFQSIKTVRLRLNLTQALVEDPSLNVKILLLVRDPRGTMESRKHRVNFVFENHKLNFMFHIQDWCPNNPDCEDPARLCQDLKEDYYSFQKLSAKFPDRYK